MKKLGIQLVPPLFFEHTRGAGGQVYLSIFDVDVSESPMNKKQFIIRVDAVKSTSIQYTIPGHFSHPLLVHPQSYPLDETLSFQYCHFQ